MLVGEGIVMDIFFILMGEVVLFRGGEFDGLLIIWGELSLCFWFIEGVVGVLRGWLLYFVMNFGGGEGFWVLDCFMVGSLGFMYCFRLLLWGIMKFWWGKVIEVLLFLCIIIYWLKWDLVVLKDWWNGCMIVCEFL